MQFYAKYGIAKSVQKFIESKIKPMEQGGVEYG